MTQRSPEFPQFGEFVKTQRALAQLSLRQASQIARISNPYLSQIEHGWVLPSVAVMSKLAEAFSLSAETMMKQAAAAAGGELPAGAATTEEAIQQDPRLGIEEKKALLLILESFTKSSAPPKKAAPKKSASTQTVSKKTVSKKDPRPTKRSSNTTSKGETT